MIVCKIWDSEYPWDVRVEKVALTLTTAGHDVHLVARNQLARPIEERLPEATVHRLAQVPWLGRRLNAASTFPAFFNPRWALHILSTAKRVRADVLLCRDLPLAPTAIWVARRLGVPAVLDMAENYPAMMRALWESDVHGRFDWAVRNPRMVERVERWVLRRIDHVLVVVEESGERLERAGVARERITLVGNTPPRSRVLATPARMHVANGGPLKLIYLGLLEAPRGIPVVLEGMAACERAGYSVMLTLIGTGRERQHFESQAAALGITSLVSFLGYVPNADALRALGDADVGVVPHVPNESWNSTIPNKLFDYMAAGLPVLTSNAIPAARVVSEAGAGEVFRHGDVDDLVAALGRLGDATRRARQGAAGRKAVLDRLNWDADAARLLGAMDAARRDTPK